VDASALRERITNSLLREVTEPNYPSVTMLNRVEAALVTEEDLANYVEVLVEKVESTRYPSTEMLNRLDRLIGQLE
jgi:hypothetical protein